MQTPHRNSIHILCRQDEVEGGENEMCLAVDFQVNVWLDKGEMSYKRKNSLVGKKTTIYAKWV